MRRLIAIGITTVFAISFHAGILLADEGLSEILDGILNIYGTLPGIEIPYEREIITGSMALFDEELVGDQASGTMYFKPVNHLKIEQKSPEMETVITDGMTLWWYVPKKAEVYKYPADKLGKELLLLSDIFRGLKGVGESFDVILEDINDEEEHQLQLIPNPPWQEVKHINIKVSRKTHKIRVVEVYNYLGGMTRFILGDHRVRKSFDKDFFNFSVPDGVKVIEEF